MQGSWKNCSVRSQAVEQSLVALLVFEIVLGLLGNAIALWTFYFHVKIWKPHTIYLFNLVIADVLLMVGLPFRIDFFLRQKQWFFGDAFCRAMLFLLALNRTGSIAFLTAVAVDRYFKVIHPHSKTQVTSSRTAKWMSCFIWLLDIAFTLPILTSSKMAVNTTGCRSFHLHPSHSFGAIWHDVVFFAGFLIPFGLILFCTIAIVKKLRERHMEKQPRMQKAVATLAAVVVVFVICFMPSNLARALVLILQKSDNCHHFSVAVNVFDVAICLTYLNSAMDPIVYCFSSPTFRYSYKRALQSMRRKTLGPQIIDPSKDSES
ncbi:12-(S)-hydroxy-5,8,10,14-eicosatetraenoic acid receptor [Pleurodeles waltl]|uniref:12-(S)-hydroxy-5,8,10,14-eicosatetraenoic acid receptor n=1 Tax=Pleurodeles waltl TaxID=8319 RepID=UPI0037097D9C